MYKNFRAEEVQGRVKILRSTFQLYHLFTDTSNFGFLPQFFLLNYCFRINLRRLSSENRLTPKKYLIEFFKPCETRVWLFVLAALRLNFSVD